MKNFQTIGLVKSGSVSDGLLVKVNTQLVDRESLFVGALVCVKDHSLRYFSIVTDIEFAEIETKGNEFVKSDENKLFDQFCKKFILSVTIKIRPMLLLQDKIARTVKNLPGQNAPVFLASELDIQDVFGVQKSDSKIFSIGKPLGVDQDVCMDLGALASRSSGIFGRTGTGKTFVTKNLLFGMLECDAAVCLIFDMHAEYAFAARSEQGGFVPGLKDFFPEKVACFSLDQSTLSARGVSADCELSFGLNQISVHDIAILADELNLHPTAIEVAYLLKKQLGEGWLARLLDMSQSDLKEFSTNSGAHFESASALARKLRQIERFKFIKKHSQIDQTEQIIQTLASGRSVVLEFGRCSSMLAYLLVSSIVTRKIHKAWVEKSEKFFATKSAKDQPKQLLIVLEEAHKFLSPAAAKQTIFGLIAREMRKYFVTLMIIDQRPSSIDQDVLSQISTKFVSQLGDERDIGATIVGSPNGQELKKIISTLAPKQEMVVFGFAIAMPIALKIKSYDQSLKPRNALIDKKEIIDQIYT